MKLNEYLAKNAVKLMIKGSAGSKLVKANSLGVPVLSENDLKAMCQ